MNMIVTPSRLSGEVEAIPSKSAAHRILICAALAREPSYVRISQLSEDIIATISCLAALGAGFTREGNGLIVRPVWNNLPSHAHLNCRESGSTLRFLLPVAAALGIRTVFTGEGRLPERPNNALLSCLRANGAEIMGDALPITVSGALRGGEYILPGDISSQYISGLLLALPHLSKPSRLRLTTPLASAGYVDLTLEALDAYGIAVRREADAYSIPARQYGEGGEHAIEGDWSGAAFWLAANALGGNIRVTGLSESSTQGDRAILSLLNEFTAGDGLSGIRIDASDIPDLVPILAVVATQARGETVIYNAARLRLKESDRLQAMRDGLTALGAEISVTADGLHIKGSTPLSGGEVDSFGDHRIAMAMAIAATVATGSVTIRNADAVSKSYPGFWQDFASLGGKLRACAKEAKQ